MPTITGSRIITEIPEIQHNQDTYALAMRMIDAASDIVGDGEGFEIGENPEYERGVAELICETLVISLSHKDSILLEIQHQAVLKREDALKRARVPF